MTDLRVLAPVTGRVVELADVPDPVFSASLVGPGLAIDPASTGRGQAVAPVAGRLVKLHPHAFVVQAADGAAVLTHLGIDTVQLASEGFELHVTEGDEVAAGDPVVTWDPARVTESGRSAVVPVVALDTDADAIAERRPAGLVEAGDLLFAWRR